jgi:tRNA A-37 threonylcarbamoyl transferase component Bud32
LDPQKFHWRIAPGFEGKLDAILSSPGEPVKESASRSVFCHRFDARRYYVKRVSHRIGSLRSARYLFKTPRSRKEWIFGRQLPVLGIPAVPLIAYGERRDWRGLAESILNTAGPEGYESLHLSPELTSSKVQRGLGSFLRFMHDRGVALRDLHPKNLLYSSFDAKFCLVDLETLSIHRRVGLAQRLDHLARLHSRLPLGEAFYGGYGLDFAQRSREVSVRAPLLRRKACLRTNDHFERRRFGKRVWQIRKAFLNPALEKILEVPEQFFASGAKVFKSTPHSIVAAERGIVLKCFPGRRFPFAIKDSLRPSRGRRAYFKAYHLELAGVSSARPIAFGPVNRLWAAGTSFFAMEEIPEAVPLRTWNADRRNTLRRLAELLGRLHEAGFSHRDLKDTNIVFDPAGKPFLIDVDGIRFRGEVGDRRALSDLDRFIRGASNLKLGKASGREAARFVIDYCRSRGRKEWRPFWERLFRPPRSMGGREF